MTVRPGSRGVARALLGNAFLVDDLDAALRVWGDGGGGWTLVTSAGETLAASGAIAGGSERSEETLLSQRRELRVLDDEVERRTSELQAARVRQDELAMLVAEREAAIRDVDAELGQVAVTVVAAEKDLQRGRQEIREIQDQQRAVASELRDVTAQLSGRREETERLEHARIATVARRGDCETAVSTAERQVAERRETVARLQEEQTSRRIALADAQARRDALTVAIDRLARVDEDAGRRATALHDRQRADRAALAETRTTAAETGGRIVQLEEAVALASAALATVEADLQRLREVTESAERNTSASQTELDSVRVRASALDLQGTEQRMALGHLEQTIRERYQRELAEVAVDALETIAGDEGQLARLRERLTGMGEVNVGAIDEIAELEERQQFLGQQRDDLERSLDDLEKTIGV